MSVDYISKSFTKDGVTMNDQEIIEGGQIQFLIDFVKFISNRTCPHDFFKIPVVFLAFAKKVLYLCSDVPLARHSYPFAEVLAKRTERGVERAVNLT